MCASRLREGDVNCSQRDETPQGWLRVGRGGVQPAVLAAAEWGGVNAAQLHTGPLGRSASLGWPCWNGFDSRPGRGRGGTELVADVRFVTVHGPKTKW